MRGRAVDEAAFQALLDLLEDAVTRFAAIRTPQMLARVLAHQARRAKAALPRELGVTLKGLREDFGKSLGIRFEGDDGEEFFRSSLVQTVFYSMFAGWALKRSHNDKSPLRWRDLADREKLRIPVLAGLFYDIKHPERLEALRLEPWLERAEATLARVDSESFFARLASPRLDVSFDPVRHAANAILYFYEPFLESFDPELRKRLGVWYTPPDIVRYQVRQVDHLLRTELGCRLGLADPEVVILDPACGTGAYLVEVLLCINERLQEEGSGGERGRQLLDAICTRVIGFEILTAPFVIAHLQLLLVLASLGVEPKSGKRLTVFLTNALTGWDGSEQLKLNFPDLVKEHEAARQVKKTARIIVVIGNPPYNRFAGAPIDEEKSLAAHYKGIELDRKGKQVGNSRLYTDWGIRKHLLDDLYIRFFRLAEMRIGEAAEYGVVSFISNSSFLTGRSHPIMRDSLLHNFDEVWIDNLHGNRIASERTPSGDSCETVFNIPGGGPGIKPGTSISTFVKHRSPGRKAGIARVHYRDFWGRAADKRRALVESLGMGKWAVRKRKEAAVNSAGPRPFESFVPTKENRWKLMPRVDVAGYDEWPSIDELFNTSLQGVNHNRGLDGGLVDVDRGVIEKRMADYFSDLPDSVLTARYPTLFQARARYEPEVERRQLKKSSAYSKDRVVPYLVFPLDSRWLYYESEGKLLNEKRPELMRNLVGNEFLVTVPQARRLSEALPMLASQAFDLHLHDRGAVGFPVEVVDPEFGTTLFSRRTGARPGWRANLTSEVWATIAKRWGSPIELDTQEARDVARRLARVCLAICHSPTYQEDHAEALAQDFARVPIATERALFDRIADAGDTVSKLLNPLVDPSALIEALLGKDASMLAVTTARKGGQVAEGNWMVSVSYYGGAKGRWQPRAVASGEPSRSQWGTLTGDLWINGETFFKNVPERVWQFELGGYPVLKKWLGYRDVKRSGGRELTLAEVQHFRSMVQRIAALLELHPQLDAHYAAAAAAPFRNILEPVV
jgi:hypothetical protein